MLTRQENIAKVWATLGKGENTYKHFKYLGRFPVRPIVDDYNYEMAKGNLVDLIPTEEFDFMTKHAGDLVMSKDTYHNLDVSVRKMDVKPVYDFEDDVYYEQTVKCLSRAYAPALIQPFMNLDEAIMSLDPDKATGFIESMCGYKKKKNWLSNYTFVDQMFLDEVLDEIVLWKASGKIEPLTRSDFIVEDKKRTFIVEPVGSLLMRKIIYGNQNIAMKNFKESAYGFNPYDGGVQVMADYLNQGRRFWMWDAKRWDRRASWMRVIYRIRNLFLSDHKFKDWVTKNTIESHVVLPNGDLIYKDWGNNSGSGNTTPDNILGMLFIIYHSILRLSCGDESMLNLIFVKCFGDDVIGSDNLPYGDMAFKRTIEETFALYGVELDPFVIKESLDGLTFLGFQFVFVSGSWIPRYSLATLCKSFLCSQRRMDKQGEICKMMSLMFMSAGLGRDTYNIFRQALLQVVFGTQEEMSKLIIKHGVPSYDQTMAWYTGLEGDGIPSEFKAIGFSFLSDQTLGEFQGKKNVGFLDGGGIKANMDLSKKGSTLVVNTPTGKKTIYVDEKGKAQVKAFVAKPSTSVRRLDTGVRTQVVRKVDRQPFKQVQLKTTTLVRPHVERKRIGGSLHVGQPPREKHPHEPTKHNHKKERKKAKKFGRNQVRDRLWNAGMHENEITRLTGKGDYKEGGGGWWDLIQGVASPLMQIAKHVIPAIMGSGDYEMGPEVNSNSVLACATQGKLGNQVPIMGEGKQCNIIRHREYLGDILSTTAEFVNQTFELNPGIDESFPWASPIANNYEQWKPLGILVEITTEASEYTDAVGLGYVCMATQYNTQSDPFTDKKTMLNHQMAVSSKPSVNLVHPIECAPSDNVLSELYTRAGSIPENADLRFYDLGRLNVAVGGQTADNVKIGELWITYDIALLTPKESSILGTGILFDHWYMTGVAYQTPLGTTGQRYQKPFSTMTGVILANRYSFQAKTRGRFMVQLLIFGTAQVIVVPGYNDQNCSVIADQYLDTNVQFRTAAGASSSTYVHGFVVDVYADDAWMEWGISGTIPSSAIGDLIITQIPKAYTFPTKGFHHAMDPSPSPKPVYPQSDIERILDKVEQAFGNKGPKVMQGKYIREVPTFEDTTTESADEFDIDDPEGMEQEYQEFLQFLKAKKNANKLTPKDRDPKEVLLTRALEPCFYCKKDNPDHVGRNCPKKPGTLIPVKRNSLNVNEEVERV